jgi:predicted RNase H-like HicB family nuclease
MRYIGLIDGTQGSYGMVFPDLPGCIVMGETIDDTVRAASEALGDWINTVEAKGGRFPWLDLSRKFGTIQR